jgi:REP element-mobilizing transposase RayT
LEFPGAIYHVINRGNYRSWVFRDDRTKAAFESCLFDACERCGWSLHAFVIMGNHYHLAIETPAGNLVAGMQWLQATFANRFNRLRGERGHLFQGRFKSLLVEDGDPLGQVCHYLHLNPVRAGITSVEKLDDYRNSSYWYLHRPKHRPRFLRVDAALNAAGQLPDIEAGWTCYRDYLGWQAVEGPAGKNAAYASMSRGWVLGSDSFKKELLRDHELVADTRAWERDGVAELKQRRWHDALEHVLAMIPAHAQVDSRKSSTWKVAAASLLKATTDVSNGWLAEHLRMGSPVYVSKHVGLLRKCSRGPAFDLLKKLQRAAAGAGKFDGG